MAYSAPISRSAIENMLIAWITRVTGLTAIWEAQDTPQPTHSYVSLRWATGATKIGFDYTQTDTDLTRAADVKVTPVAANNTTYTVTLNGNGYQYLSDADATVAEICTGLVAAITEPDVTATDNATDFDIEVDTAGDTFTIVLSDDDTGALMTWVNNDTGHEVEVAVGGPRLQTLSVNVHCDQASVTAGTGADYYMDIISGSIHHPEELLYRDNAGVGLHTVNPPINLDGVVGAGFLERRQMDIVLSFPSNFSLTSGYVDTVQITSSDLDWTDKEFP